MLNNTLTGAHHSAFLHPSLVRVVTVQLGTSISDRLGITHVHHEALELSQPSLSCVHLHSLLHSLSPDSFTCLEEKLRDQRSRERFTMLTEAPSCTASIQTFSRIFLLAFHLKDNLQEAPLFFPLPWTWLKGSSQLSGVAALDLTHHHSQICKEEPHPWELEKGTVLALVRH